MISIVDSKAEGILHGPTTMGRWVASFPDFASRIEWKLVDCKIVETCCPGSGLAEDQPGAPRHEYADIIQEHLYGVCEEEWIEGTYCCATKWSHWCTLWSC